MVKPWPIGIDGLPFLIAWDFFFWIYMMIYDDICYIMDMK